MSILVIEHSSISRANRLGETLTRHGHRLDIRRIHEGDAVPADTRSMDGLIIMGSPGRLSGNDAPDYAQAEMHLARLAHEAGIPIVGICFGCQILAAALGGAVSPLADGVRVGMHIVTQTTAGHDDPLLAGLPWSMPCLHWNHDVASALPPDGVCLAKGPAGDHQIWKKGVRTYAFQFHPEVTPDTVDAIITQDHPDLDAAGISEEAVREQVATAWPAYRRLTDRLLDSIAMVLMPIDLRTVDVVRDLRH
jgi:GMP synthase-like glutamine amidotransferase